MATKKAMSGAQEKIECVRQALLEELELGAELSPHGPVHVRSIDDRKVCDHCGITDSQLRGILDRFKEEGFIVDHSLVAAYLINEPGTIGGLSTEVSFPATSPQSKVRSSKVVASITRGEKEQEIVINKKYLLARPRFLSQSDRFFDHVYKHANTTTTSAQIRKAMGGDYAGPNQFLYDLGFRGTLRSLFFPGASAEGVHFRNPVTSEDLKRLKLSKQDFEAELSKLDRTQ